MYLTRFEITDSQYNVVCWHDTFDEADECKLRENTSKILLSWFNTGNEWEGGSTLIKDYEKDPHADRRDSKRNKARYGMQVTARSIKSVLLPLIGKKASKVDKNKTG